MKLTLEVIFNRELDALSRYIAVSRPGLGQDVSLPDLQPGYRMRFFPGSPGVSGLSGVLLDNRKICSFDFLLPGQVRLGDLDLLINQVQFIVCVRLIGYRELDRRCKDITFRCLGLNQLVSLADNKTAYRMSRSIGYPVVNDLSVLIHDLQMGTSNHGDLGIHLADKDLAVDQSDLLVRVFLRDSEVSRLRHSETCRSAFLNQAVSMSDDQTTDRVSLAIGNPGIDQLAKNRLNLC